MNYKKIAVVILLSLVIFSTANAIYAEDKEYSIIDALIDLTIQEDGLLHVNESYTYSFEGTFNGVYRDIPLKDGENIDNLNVYVDGAYGSYEVSEKNNKKHVKVYLWADEAHTQKIHDQKVKVTYSYDMKNVVTLYNDVGSLQYKLWGENWECEVLKLTCNIHLPGDNGNSYYLNPEYYNLSDSISGNTIHAQTKEIPSGKFYELQVLMPLDDFSNATNAKHVNADGKEQIMQKQADLLDAQTRLLEAKSQQTGLLREVIGQRRQLSAQQVEQRKKVDGLKKEETGLQGQVAQQQKQLAALDKKIDELIAYEIEQARKKAEEEARRKAAEEAARKKKQAVKGQGAKGKGQGAKSQGQGTPTSKSGTWLTAEDRQLNGTFEQNKGRLPVPITGQYMLGSRFGLYNVPGMKDVQLDNKGTNYVGRPGARARAVFDGVVTSVFQFAGTRNVLVRHGSYISVYCNLSSTIVKKGQKVRARDILGTVADDGSGNCTLHFQLRKETVKLNPEAWIGR